MADDTRYEEALANGHSYNWDQRWEEAVVAFELAIREHPDRPAPYAGLGIAYFSLNQYENALESYQLAARHSQGDIIYLRQVADIQERLGLALQAAQTYLAIGEILYRRHSLEQAVDNWSRAVRLDPDLLRAHQRLARYYAAGDMVPEATQSFLQTARIFQAKGESETALSTCRLALQFNPNDSSLLDAVERLQEGEPIPPPIQESDSIAAENIPALPEVSLADVSLDWQSGDQLAEGGLLPDARQTATEQLAGQIFSDAPDESQADTSSSTNRLSKLERDALISQAIDFDGRHDVNEAISCYEKALAGGVTDAAAHFNLGLLYKEKSRLEPAIREFSMAMQDQAYWLAGHFALGESYRMRGQIDDALKHFLTVLKTLDAATMSPEQTPRLMELYDSLAHNLIAGQEDGRKTAFINALVGFLSQKGWQEKIQEARLRLDALAGERIMILGDLFTTGSARVLEALYLSQEYERQGHFNTAIEEAYRAISSANDYLPAHIRLAELLVRQRQDEAAAEKFEVIGDTYRARGDISGAIAMYERVAALSPLNLSIRYQLIDLLRRDRQTDRALEQYVALGAGQLQLGQLDQARHTYLAALKLAPQSSQEELWRDRLLRLVADVDMQRQEWHLALASYCQLRYPDPLDESTANTVIDLCFKVGQPEMAIQQLDDYFMQLIEAGREGEVPEFLTAATGRHPDSVGLLERLISLYLARGRKAEAKTALNRLVELHVDAGQFEDAADALAIIIKLDPSNAASYLQLHKQLQ